MQLRLIGINFYQPIYLLFLQVFTLIIREYTEYLRPFIANFLTISAIIYRYLSIVLPLVCYLKLSLIVAVTTTLSVKNRKICSLKSVTGSQF